MGLWGKLTGGIGDFLGAFNSTERQQKNQFEHIERERKLDRDDARQERKDRREHEKYILDDQQAHQLEVLKLQLEFQREVLAHQQMLQQNYLASVDRNGGFPRQGYGAGGGLQPFVPGTRDTSGLQPFVPGTDTSGLQPFVPASNAGGKSPLTPVNGGSFGGGYGRVGIGASSGGGAQAFNDILSGQTQQGRNTAIQALDFQFNRAGGNQNFGGSSQNPALVNYRSTPDVLAGGGSFTQRPLAPTNGGFGPAFGGSTGGVAVPASRIDPRTIPGLNPALINVRSPDEILAGGGSFGPSPYQSGSGGSFGNNFGGGFGGVGVAHNNPYASNPYGWGIPRPERPLPPPTYAPPVYFQPPQNGGGGTTTGGTTTGGTTTGGTTTGGTTTGGGETPIKPVEVKYDFSTEAGKGAAKDALKPVNERIDSILAKTDALVASGDLTEEQGKALKAELMARQEQAINSLSEGNEADFAKNLKVLDGNTKSLAGQQEKYGALKAQADDVLAEIDRLVDEKKITTSGAESARAEVKNALEDVRGSLDDFNLNEAGENEGAIFKRVGTFLDTLDKGLDKVAAKDSEFDKLEADTKVENGTSNERVLHEAQHLKW